MVQYLNRNIDVLLACNAGVSGGEGADNVLGKYGMHVRSNVLSEDPSSKTA